jgi:hypothetical protein
MNSNLSTSVWLNYHEHSPGIQFGVIPDKGKTVQTGRGYATGLWGDPKSQVRIHDLLRCYHFHNISLSA